MQAYQASIITFSPLAIDKKVFTRMLCRVCCTRGEKAGKTTQPCPTCAAACRDTAFTSLGQHWALDQFCTGWSMSSAKDSSISQFWTTRGFSENPELLEQLKNKKCDFLDPSLWGGKALVPLTAEHLFCCTEWIISGTRCTFTARD